MIYIDSIETSSQFYRVLFQPRCANPYVIGGQSRTEVPHPTFVSRRVTTAGCELLTDTEDWNSGAALSSPN